MWYSTVSLKSISCGLTNVSCERSILDQALAFPDHAGFMSQAAALVRQGAADFSLLGTQKTPIEKTELRGITLPQLEQLDDFIERHADEHGVLHGWLDREGQPLHKDRINLYDVVKYVVKPATKEHKCSYVELVAPAGSS